MRQITLAKIRRLALATAIASVLAGCGGGPGADDSTGSTAQAMMSGSGGTSIVAIIGGSDDANTPEANVVVRVNDKTAQLCTGTLITPTLALTAKHCITGTVDGEIPRGVPPYTVTIGAQLPFAVVDMLSQDTRVPIATYEGNSNPLDSEEYGGDLAIIFLDPAHPALDVHVVRPTLTPPGPEGSDGTYSGLLAMAGWSPESPTPLTRQVAWINSIFHEDGHPDFFGQVWTHDRERQSGQHGDSGGPLFFQAADGTRDVIGVYNGWQLGVFSDTDLWTDITRGHPRDWLRSVAVDASRSAAWLTKHGQAEHWYGELDPRYDRTRDRDGDHWNDDHDNCPDTRNFDQAETSPGGWGTACPNGAGQTVGFGTIDPPTGSASCIQTCYRTPNGMWRCSCLTGSAQ